jgi:uncharacterized membrane protein YbhN (UPF0104 family)
MMVIKTNNKPSQIRPLVPRYIKNLLKLVLVAVVLYFVSKQISRHWGEIVNYDWNISPWMLGLSIITHIVTFVMFSLVWCQIISGFGYNVSVKHGFKLSYISNLGRYLPGKFWTIFAMAYLARRLDIKEEESMASWIIALIFALPTGFLIGFITVIFYPQILSDKISAELGLSVYIFSGLTLLASILLIFAPKWTLALLNYFLKLIHRPAITFKVDRLTALKIYGGYIASWIMYGISFWIFLHSVLDSPTVPAAGTIGMYVFAYQIGYVAIFTPGGIGVREFALWVMLEPYIGKVAIGVAVAARLWNIVVELISTMIALAIKLPSEKSK